MGLGLDVVVGCGESVGVAVGVGVVVGCAAAAAVSVGVSTGKPTVAGSCVSAHAANRTAAKTHTPQCDVGHRRAGLRAGIFGYQEDNRN